MALEPLELQQLLCCWAQRVVALQHALEAVQAFSTDSGKVREGEIDLLCANQPLEVVDCTYILMLPTRRIAAQI